MCLNLTIPVCQQCADNPIRCLLPVNSPTGTLPYTSTQSNDSHCTAAVAVTQSTLGHGYHASTNSSTHHSLWPWEADYHFIVWTFWYQAMTFQNGRYSRLRCLCSSRRVTNIYEWECKRNKILDFFLSEIQCQVTMDFLTSIHGEQALLTASSWWCFKLQFSNNNELFFLSNYLDDARKSSTPH